MCEFLRGAEVGRILEVSLNLGLRRLAPLSNLETLNDGKRMEEGGARRPPGRRRDRPDRASEPSRDARERSLSDRLAGASLRSVRLCLWRLARFSQKR